MSDKLIQISIVPDQATQDLLSSLEMVSAKKLPNTVRAVKVVTSLLEYTWKSYAMGGSIPGTNIKIKTINTLYVKSIKTKVSGLSGIVYSDSPEAASIEDGTEERDLKKIIPFGKKSRKGKNGPYTIVPFRHGIPGSTNVPMPDAFYKKVLQQIKKGELKKSKVLKKTTESSNAKGQSVKRRTYKWGGRVKETTFPDLQGMVVFDVSGGLGNRSAYMTFRVVSANKPKISKAKKGWQNSWIVPAQQGKHLTRYVVANTKGIISEIVKSGISQDLT